MRIVSVVGFLALVAVTISGCSTAGHIGKIDSDKGLEAMCAGGCLEYREDATGCAVFHESTSQSCAKYFEVLCEAEPKQCVSASSKQ